MNLPYFHSFICLHDLALCIIVVQEKILLCTCQISPCNLNDIVHLQKHKSTLQMYTGTTFLTTYTKCLLYTTFASDKALKCMYMQAQICSAAGQLRLTHDSPILNSKPFYLQLVHIPLNKRIRLYTRFINDMRFGVLPFLLTFTFTILLLHNIIS